MDSGHFLEVNDLTFRYFEQSKRNILDHVSFSAGRGMTTVFLGKSGCGKSTLAAACAGLYPENGGIISSGSVLLDGTPVESLNPSTRAPLLSLLFQNPDLQFCMDSLRNELRFCMENISTSPDDMDLQIQRLSDDFHLEALLDRKLHTLSGGEKQKAALCCLFALHSKGLFLDEPFANIDKDSASDLIRLLKQQKEKAGLTLLVIDHKPDCWMDIADEFIILGEGAKVIKRGITPQNIYEHEALFCQEGIFFPKKQSTPAAVKNNVSSSARPAIVLHDLTLAKMPHPNKKEPDEFLLSHAQAVFYPSQITAILGPSGAGKTSLFYTLLGRRPYSGSIQVFGRELKTWKPRSLYKELGMVFQNPGNQFITQNVQEEISQSLRIWKRSEDPKALLTSFGLGTYCKYSPYMLSQGQQRRLAVLSMLAGGQRILLLDEPTYGQDAHSVSALMEQLAKRVKQEGLAVILITHDHELAAAYADRAYLLKNKQLLAFEKGGESSSWNG